MQSLISVDEVGTQDNTTRNHLQSSACAMNERKVQRFLFKFATVVTYLLFAGFTVVLPLDIIAQCSRSSVFNTFIAVGGIVLIGIITASYALGRILIHRKQLRFIPKFYLPLLQMDIPSKNIWKLLWLNLKLSKKLTSVFLKPDKEIIHDGLSPPEYVYEMHKESAKNGPHTDIFSDEAAYTKDDASEASFNDGTSVFDDLPPSTNYEQVLKVLFDKLKYEGNLSNSFNLKNEESLGITFAQYVNKIKTRVHQQTPSHSPRNIFMNPRMENSATNFYSNEMDFDFDAYIRQYHKFRFSGRPINKREFKEFMDNTLLLFKIYALLLTKQDQFGSRSDVDSDFEERESVDFSLDTDSSHSWSSASRTNTVSTGRDDPNSARLNGNTQSPLGESELHGYFPAALPSSANLTPIYNVDSAYSFESVRKRR